MSAVLTRREREVVELVGRPRSRRTYKEAALELGIAYSTVRVYVFRACRRFGVDDPSTVFGLVNKKATRQPSPSSVNLWAEEDGSPGRPTAA